MDATGRRWYQIQSLRDITGSNFTSGQIRFNFSVDGETSWNPSKSFFKIRNHLVSFNQKSGDDYALRLILTMSDGLAPVQYFGDAFWQSIEVKINGTTINKQDNYYYQISALRHRMDNEEWNKTWNKINFHEYFLSDRASKLTYDGFNHKYPEYDIIDLYEQVSNEAGAVACQWAITNVGVLTFSAGAFTDFVGTISGLLIPGSTIMLQTAAGFYSLCTIVSYTTSLSFQVKLLEGDAITAKVAGNLAPGDIQIFSNGIKTPFKNVPYKKYFENIWVPKMGFFDIDDWLPGGEFEIILTPFPASSLKYHIWEAYNDYFIKDIDHQIVDMNLYLCITQHKSNIKSIKYVDTKCLQKTINIASLTQKQFIINPKAFALTLAFQDSRTPTRFMIPGNKFSILDDTNGQNYNRHWEWNLTRFNIQFDSDLLPNPEPDIRISTKSEEFIAQQYWETMQNRILMDSDIETMDEWMEKGMYFHFQWPRKNTQAKEVQISCEFGTALPNNIKPNMLLFYHYKVAYSFAMEGGKIIGVKKTD